MNRAVVGVVAAGLIFAGAGAAVADWGKPIPLLTSEGAQFRDGRYKFNPAGTNHGSFEWLGRLQDTFPDDGHNAYVEVGVEGRDWVRYYGKQGRSVSLHQSNWVGSQRYTSEARIRVCRDRGAIHPNNCSIVKRFESRRD